jgi:hypothetical protein
MEVDSNYSQVGIIQGPLFDLLVVLAIGHHRRAGRKLRSLPPPRARPDLVSYHATAGRSPSQSLFLLGFRVIPLILYNAAFHFWFESGDK